MILTIHRGSKQIGGSCVELQADGGQRLLLDVGMPLTRPDGSDWPRGTMTRPSEELRAEGVLPDIDGLYAGSVPEFSGIVLSHAHLDHHGLAHHVHQDVPVHCSLGTSAMLEVSGLFIPDAVAPGHTHDLPIVDPVMIGPFAVQGIPVDHAAPDSRALLVEADGQRVLYSGDLRAHGRQSHLFEALPDAAGQVDVLILEGTTMGQAPGLHGFADEWDVERGLADLLIGADGLVVVIASGQNVDRAISVYRAALEAGRELVLDPYQAFVLMKLKDVCPDAPQFDWPSVRVKFVPNHVRRLKEAGFWHLACQMSRAGKVTSEQLFSDPGRFVYLARSSQATVGLLRHLPEESLPTIVWSQWGGYLKKGGAIPRFCEARGIEPVLIHSGGHAHPEDLARLADRLRPRVVVPIHTEAAPHFSSVMANVRVIDDGDSVDVRTLSTLPETSGHPPASGGTRSGLLGFRPTAVVQSTYGDSVSKSTKTLLRSLEEELGRPLLLPPLPDDLRPLSEQDPTPLLYGSPLTTEGRPYLAQGHIDEFLAEAPVGYLLVGFWGYGINSYAFYYCTVTSNSRIFLRLPYGGVYMGEQEREALFTFFERFTPFLQRTLPLVSSLKLVESMGYSFRQFCLQAGRVIEETEPSLHPDASHWEPLEARLRASDVETAP